MLGRIFNALTSCQSEDGVNVQSLIGNDACGSLNLAGFQLASHDHENVSVLALMAYPVFILVVSNG